MEARTSDVAGTVGAALYKTISDRTEQMKQDSDVQDKDIERQSYGWRQKATIGNKYGSYWTQFLEKLS